MRFHPLLGFTLLATTLAAWGAQGTIIAVSSATNTTAQVGNVGNPLGVYQKDTDSDSQAGTTSALSASSLASDAAYSTFASISATFFGASAGQIDVGPFGFSEGGTSTNYANNVGGGYVYEFLYTFTTTAATSLVIDAAVWTFDAFDLYPNISALQGLNLALDGQGPSVGSFEPLTLYQGSPIGSYDEMLHHEFAVDPGTHTFRVSGSIGSTGHNISDTDSGQGTVSFSFTPVPEPSSVLLLGLGLLGLGLRRRV